MALLAFRWAWWLTVFTFFPPPVCLWVAEEQFVAGAKIGFPLRAAFIDLRALKSINTVKKRWLQHILSSFLRYLVGLWPLVAPSDHCQGTPGDFTKQRPKSKLIPMELHPKVGSGKTF